MTHPVYANAVPSQHEDSDITVTLLDALCSPHLYDIVECNGELYIKPRIHMHCRKPEAGPERELMAA
jgi:hypothetical protein